MLAPLAPVLHEYVLAPLAVNVAVWPAQILTLLAVTVGLASTLTEAVVDWLHPVVAPLTVYVAFEVGVTVTLAPVAPVLQV
jgi:uncharacterized protein involved in cysteine biosynthesis